MGKQENVQRLRDLLAEHIVQGGKNEIVVYCSTGHLAGLVAGVLGLRGFNVKNLQYGFDIAWTGTSKNLRAVIGL
jgi:rhodanese-related sulfurtransferase